MNSSTDFVFVAYASDRNLDGEHPAIVVLCASPATWEFLSSYRPALQAAILAAAGPLPTESGFWVGDCDEEATTVRWRSPSEAELMSLTKLSVINIDKEMRRKY